MPNYIKILLTFSLLALAGSGFAQHNSEYDVYINVDEPITGELAEDLKVGETGDDLYDTQEGVHETGKDLTGEEVEHYYIHICLSGQCVPVDPMRVSN